MGQEQLEDLIITSIRKKNTHKSQYFNLDGRKQRRLSPIDYLHCATVSLRRKLAVPIGEQPR